MKKFKYWDLNNLPPLFLPLSKGEIKWGYIFLCLSISIFPTVVQAGFEDIGVSARSNGMSNMFVALADDAYTIYYNPAGLAQLKIPQIGSSYAMLYQGLTDATNIGTQFVSVAYPMMKRGKNELGLGFSYSGFTVGGLYEETAITVAAAKDLEQFIQIPIRVGANVKMLSKKYGDNVYMENVFDSNSKSAFGIDAGTIYELSKEITIGGAVFNVNQPDIGVKYADPLPMGIKFGAIYKQSDYVAGADVSMREQNINVGVGGEKWFRQKTLKTVAVRAGATMDNNKKTTVTGGASYRLPNMGGFVLGIDYALLYPLTNAKNTMTHWISLQVAFGGDKLAEPVRKGVSISAIAKPEFISPNEDGIGDKTEIALSSGEFRNVASWQIVVKKDKTVVKTVEGTYLIPESVIWDGKDEKGIAVPDGNYAYTFKVKDGSGNEENTRERSLVVDTKPPVAGVSLSSPVFSPDGDGVDDKITFSLQASDDTGIDNWICKISDSKNKNVKKYTGKGLPPQVEWDGKDDYYQRPVTSGNYKCELIIFDLAGNKSTAEATIEANTGKPVTKEVVKEVVKEITKEIVKEVPTVKGMEFTPIPEGQKAVLQFFKLFDTKGKVKPESYDLLDQVVKVLEDNTTSKVRIEGHTDTSSGNDMLNMKTSEARAKAVYNFLVMRGIPAERLSFVGIGSMKPLVPEEKTDADRVQNRRVEIIILK